MYTEDGSCIGYEFLVVYSGQVFGLTFDAREDAVKEASRFAVGVLGHTPLEVEFLTGDELQDLINDHEDVAYCDVAEEKVIYE